MAESRNVSKNASSNRMGMDFFSRLPDEIIHVIISFLNTMDAIKLTVLSKRFRFVLYSSPNIDYTDEELLSPTFVIRSDYMLGSLNQSIIHRSSVGSLNTVGVDKFRFRATPHDEIRRYELVESARNTLNSAIVYALQHNVKELDYSFPCFWEQLYQIPVDVFTSKSVRVLKLEFTEITSSILNSMTELEFLRIMCCKVPEDFTISGFNIKRMNLGSNRGCKKIEIAAPNLELVSYRESNHQVNCDISFIGCENLKHLFLDTDNITDEWLAYHLLGFPLLEVLKLYSCRRLSDINIDSGSNDKLRKVFFNSFRDKIKICVPNLESFGLRDSFMESFNIDITTCKTLKDLRLYHVHVLDSWLEDNLPEFPFLEKLRLVCCHLLRSIYIRDGSNDMLKTIDLQSLTLINIDICITDLESFAYITKCECSCDIDISACTNLRLLTLSGVTIDGDSWLVNNVLPFPFPLLEHLTLNECRFLEKTNLYGNLHRLKDMQLTSCSLLNRVDMNVSNLSSFTYAGEPPFPVMFINSRVLHAKLTLRKGSGCIPQNDYFLMILRVLVLFDHCKVVGLICNDALISVSREYRSSLPSPLINVLHLEVEMCELSDLEKLLESLLWLSRCPDTISFRRLWSDKKMLLSFKYDANMDFDEPVTHLNHRLSVVTMDNFDEDEVIVLYKFFKRESSHLKLICFNQAPSS